ncbi:MAG: galactose-1-phosphate uridylyltransferase [Thermoproteota archaeon]
MNSLIVVAMVHAREMIQMPHLRWNPILAEWIIVSPARHARPVLEEKGCPFCPGAEEVKGDWDVISIPNKYPALLSDCPEPKSMTGYLSKPAKGVAEVVITSRHHDNRLDTMPERHIKKVLSLFSKRTLSLYEMKYIKYVYVFENFGSAIGVTLTHPHAQIYGMPFVPPIIRREVASAKKYIRAHRRCLFCTIISKEVSSQIRLVSQNKHFVTFIPFYARWAFEVHIYPRRHVAFLHDLNHQEIRSLAKLLKRVVAGFNSLYGFPFSYVMAFHQTPMSMEHGYHLHIEFYPPHRQKDKLKHFAGIEQGAGTFLSDTLPEEKASELREKITRYDPPVHD